MLPYKCYLSINVLCYMYIPLELVVKVTIIGINKSRKSESIKDTFPNALNTKLDLVERNKRLLVNKSTAAISSGKMPPMMFSNIALLISILNGFSFTMGYNCPRGMMTTLL